MEVKLLSMEQNMKRVDWGFFHRWQNVHEYDVSCTKCLVAAELLLYGKFGLNVPFKQNKKMYIIVHKRCISF